MKIIKIIFALIFTIYSLLLSSQNLTIDQTSLTPQQLVENILVSGCIEVSNVTYNDPSGNSIGYFNTNGANFPVSEGVFFGTMDNATNATGANIDGGSGTFINGGGSVASDFIGNSDPDLQGINGGVIYEAAILEFDFIPQSDTLKFNYVLASEEYPEFECSQYNDVFGFFLTGPNPSGADYASTNIALIPGTTIPVGINSVNTGNQYPGSYPMTGCNPSNPSLLAQYMGGCTDPTWGPQPASNAVTSLDGYTVKLTAIAVVEPCQTYHIKLAIGDVTDADWDSGIFLEKGSFNAGSSVDVQHYANNVLTNDVVEGCDNYFVFTRGDTLDTSSPQVVNFNISGDVDMGTDIIGFPSTITIPAGQTSITVPYSAIADGITEGSESFIFTYVDGCLCSGGADTILITIHDAETPLLEITPNTTICIGDTATINLTENNPNLNLSDLNIIWDNGSNDSSLSFVAQSANTYTHTAHITYGCGFDTTLTCVITSENCTFNILANDTAICPNDTAFIYVQNIDGEEPVTYQWSNGLPTNAGPFAVSPSTTTNYIVTVTDASGAISIDTVTVTVFNEIQTEFNATNVSCFGLSDGIIDLTIINPTSTYTFDWSNDGSGDNDDNEDLTNLSAGNYSVTITDINTCRTSNTITITQPTELQLTLNASELLCYGDTNGEVSVITTGGTPEYTYLWNTGTTSNLVNNLSGGIYTVTVSDANGCIKTDSVELTSVGEPLQINYTKTDNPCFGYNEGTINTNVTGGTPPYSYKWSTTDDTPNLSNLYAGTYNLTVTDTNECTVSESIVINEPTKLFVSLPADQTICKNSDFQIQSSTTGGTTPYQYYWNTGNVADNISINLIDSAVYSITVTDANNCTATDEIKINTFELPYLISFANKDTVCPGDPVIISSTVTGGASPFTYTVNGDIADFEQTVYPYQTALYQTKVTDACGNFDNNQVSIYTYNIPVLSISSDILQGCPPLTVSFNEGSNVNGAIYNWNFDDNDENNYTYGSQPTHTFDQSGVYDVSVEMTTKEGCKVQQTISDMITVFPQPEAMFEATPEVVSFIDPTVNFTNLSTENYNNYWYFGDGEMSSIVNPYHKYSNIGEYDVTLIVKSEYACVDSVKHHISVQDEFTLYVPTAFSPDGDGINDGFRAVGNGIDTDNFILRVYDRWGEVIWESTDLYEEWKGTAKNSNKIVQNGTYKWLVICKDFNGVEYTKSGNVTVIR